jgi:uncharacterized protein (TIGR02145 family)
MKHLLKIIFIVIISIALIAIMRSCKKVTVPDVTTVIVSDITQASALSGGNVTDDGGAEVTDRGVCWNIADNPTIANIKTSNGTGTGPFTSNLTQLTSGTKYYVRAYATNSEGTGYGNQVSFTTDPPDRLATLTTTEVSSIASIYAVSGGNVSDNGLGSDMAGIDCGICWSTSQNPTISDNKTRTFLLVGSFTDDMTGLSAKTTYYVRAYATNGAGTAYGNQVSFTTSEGQISFNTNLTYGSVSDIDGNVYKTIQIGTQTWMAEDLKATKYSDGTVIQLTSGTSAWEALATTSKSYCYYNDNANSTSSFGALYTWAAAMNGSASSTTNPSGVQGVCPAGWHLPSDVEWTTLSNYLGGENVTGGKMKEAGTSHWYDPNIGATNESGFTALPGGSRFGYGLCYGNAFFGYWWSSTEYSTENAWIIGLSTYGNEFSKYYGYEKKSGYSIRCLKN